MEKNELENWIKEIKENILLFIKEINVDKKVFCKYSAKGNLLPNSLLWGLSNDVFLLKIIYILDLKFSNSFYQKIFNHIDLFKSKEERYYDDSNLSRLGLLRNIIKNKSLRNNFNYLEKNKIAQTKQTLAVFYLYNKPFKNIDILVPENIENQIRNLNWKEPWGAGSHFNHLIFSLSMKNSKSKEIEKCFEILNNSYIKEDGWYTGKPSARQKINGVMKILRAMNLYSNFSGKNLFLKNYSKNFWENIINLVLENNSRFDSCDYFNSIYVITNSSKILSNKYRYEEIDIFIKKTLNEFKLYYYPKYGAFRFSDKKLKFFLGAPIAYTRNSPDIQGTLMYIWALAIISNFYDVNKKYKLKEMVV